MAKKKQTENKKFAVWQRTYKVGYKKPPKEHQFQPGQSGNPNGPPKRRTNLWVWFCTYMDMNDAQIKKLKPEKLTQAQQTALKLLENAKDGKYSGSERLARYVIDRDEGKALERVAVEDNKAMSPEECDRLREILRWKMELSEAMRQGNFPDKQKATGK